MQGNHSPFTEGFSSQLIQSIILLFGVFLLVSGALYYESKRFDGVLQFVVLDVGQGTGVYIKTPSGVEILYDVGAERKTLRALEKFRPWYDRSLDYVIASHADQDHIGALPDVLDAYRVEKVVMGPGSRESDLLAMVNKRVDHYQIEREIWYQGKSIIIDEETVLHVLHPRIEEQSSGNDDSLVLLLSHGDKQFLLTGDISAEVEKDLVAYYRESLDVEVLLASHHGSKSSSALEFLQATSPAVCIISAGEANRYGHPHQEVLSRARTLGISILETSREGSVRLLSDGSRLVLE